MSASPPAIVEVHARAPSALAFMARAFLPSPGLTWDGRFPSIVERWTGLRIAAAHLDAFHAATGMPRQAEASILYPHVIGFRLQMALLTHRAYPFPIWNALQIRNHLIRHRGFGPGDTLDLTTRVDAFRAVDKGVEVDLRSTLSRGSECVWESVVTYFYRGQRASATSDARPPAQPAPDDAAVVATFLIPKNGGWRFGALTGDYNGIHWSSWYARRLGFRAAFLHPQRAAGMCLARLPALNAEAQSLDLWIKGPLFYGAAVTLRAGPGDNDREPASVFGLSLDGDGRAALSGAWRETAHARS